MRVPEQYPWYEPPFYDELAEQARRLSAEEGTEVGRAFIYFSLYIHHSSGILTPLLALFRKGEEQDPDAWVPLRLLAEAAGVAVGAAWNSADFGYDEQVDRNGRIAERVLTLADERGAGASDDVREEAEKWRRRLTFRESPAHRPSRSPEGAPWGHRSRELGHESRRGSRDLFLQSPLDRHFIEPRDLIDDRPLRTLMDEWVDDADVNYRDLVASIGNDCLEHADVAFDAVALDDNGEDVTGLQSPAAMQAHKVIKGDAARKELVATRNLVIERGTMPQPDGIHAYPGECWRILGHRLGDGTVMPCRGTYRLSRADG